jgi:DNA polymerase III epsilon subunit-like protein
MAVILFFDTETTGKAGKNANPVDPNDWPDIMQIAWAVYYENGELAWERCHLIKPPIGGWQNLQQEALAIHGLTVEYCQANGVHIVEALRDFKQAIDGADRIVAHNMGFDRPVVRSAMMREKVTPERNPRRQFVCTMLSAVGLCRLPGKYKGQYKWPKLSELHQHLFGCQSTEPAHDALGDIRTLAKCYFEMARLGVEFQVVD